MSETKVRHFQDWWRHKFGFVPHGDRVVCTLCHKSIVTRTSSVRRHFNTKHGPLIPPSFRQDYIKKCVLAFENMQPRPELAQHAPTFTHHELPTFKRDGKRSPSPDSKICLKWNTYHTNIQTIFPSLLLNEQFVDVTLACEGRYIKCHKVILSACSPYFEELLSQNPCQHPIVLMKDIKFWEMQALVEFMYSGEVNVAEEKLPSLLRAAEALQVKGLTNVNQMSNNDSADSEEIPFDKVKAGTTQPKYGRRKRKSSDSTGKSNESSQNELPAEKKIMKDDVVNRRTSSRRVKKEPCGTGEMEEMFETSNHPPLETGNGETSQPLTSTTMAFENSDMIKQEQISEESSQETDSEQEKYTFNMDRTLLTDDTINPHRDRIDKLKQPLKRSHDYNSK